MSGRSPRFAWAVLVVPSALAGLLLAGSASFAAAAGAKPVSAQLTAVSGSTASATPTPSPSSTPTPSPSSTPTPSPSSTPTPTPSGTSTSPSDRLHLSVQALAPSVQAGGLAHFGISVWLAGQVNGTAKISITAIPGQSAPRFTACAAPGRTVCSVALIAAKPVQLQAAVAVPQEGAGTRVTLTATGTSLEAAVSASGSGSIPVVEPPPTPAATAAGTPSATSGAGVVLPVSLQVAGLPVGGLPPGVLPFASLPLLPPPSPVTNVGQTFPVISPGSDLTPASAPIRVIGLSASSKPNPPLAGVQIISLVILGVAVTVALFRFSLGKQWPRHSRAPD